MSDFTRDEPTGAGLKWCKGTTGPDESFRWISDDGRWVAVSAGYGEELGIAFVSSSSGERVQAESFEHALQLAKELRT